VQYWFGDYTLIADRRELLYGGEPVPVAPQVFDLLEYLIRNRERVISKDELIASVWRGRNVSDAALTTRIHVARAAIADSGTEQRLIKTLPRKGVRFVGVVSVEPKAASPTGMPSAVLGVPSSTSLERPSLAVLAFIQIADARGWEQIGQQLADDVSIDLARLRWLRVVSSPIPTQFELGGGVRTSLREAGVRYMLDGSIRPVRERCRVTVRLTEVFSGSILWGASYVSSLSKIVAGDDDVSGGIVHAVMSVIGESERARALRAKSGNLGTWEAYQCGMWHMSRGDAGMIDTASSYFRQAIDSDPSFASAYSALAWASLMAASIYSRMSVDEGCELARPLVHNAISLDGADPEGVARLAFIEFLRGDVDSAIGEAETALSFAPGCASALGVKGAALISIGRRAEGREAIGKFLQLSTHDPIRPVRLTQVATSYYLDGNYEHSATTTKRIIRRYPRHPYAYRWLAASLGQLGKIEEATMTLQTLERNWPSSFEMYVAKQPPAYCSAEYKPLLQGLRKAGWKD
jgi:DNA-binding winged helix-turn-helix (wHTH) protein/tetratricopeptide (TPR) repeat protein